jgi:hypothetical protein
MKAVLIFGYLPLAEESIEYIITCHVFPVREKRGGMRLFALLFIVLNDFLQFSSVCITFVGRSFGRFN